MNKTKIWKKAKTQYYSGYTTIEGIGRNKEYSKIQDLESLKKHQVSLEYTENGVLYSCDCTFNSLPRQENLDKGRQPLCSHILTLILYKIGKEKIK